MDVAVFIAVTLLLGTVASLLATKLGDLTWPGVIALVAGACIVAVPLTAVLLNEDDDVKESNTARSAATTTTAGPSPATSALTTTLTSIRPMGIRVAFADDFSEPLLGGWPTEIEGTTVAGYSNGEYVVRAPPSGWRNLFPQGGGSRLNQLSVEVDGRRMTSTGAKFGVVCRHGGNDKPFYAAWVDGTGFFQIFQATAEVPIENLALGRDPIAAAEGGRNVRVKLECLGSEGQSAVLRLSVNDRPVAETTVPAGLPAGAVGLITGGLGMPGADIAFDNFTVMRIGG